MRYKYTFYMYLYIFRSPKPGLLDLEVFSTTGNGWSWIQRAYHSLKNENRGCVCSNPRLIFLTENWFFPSKVITFSFPACFHSLDHSLCVFKSFIPPTFNMPTYVPISYTNLYFFQENNTNACSLGENVVINWVYFVLRFTLKEMCTMSSPLSVF